MADEKVVQQGDGKEAAPDPRDARIAELQSALEAREAREAQFLEAIRAQAARDRDDDEKPRDMVAELAGDQRDVEIDPEKFAEELTKNPKAALAKFGLVSRREAAEMSVKAAREAAREAIAEYGAKKDAESREYADLVAQYPEITDQSFVKDLQAEIREVTGGDARKATETVIKTAIRAVKANRALAAKANAAKDDGDDGRLAAAGRTGGRPEAAAGRANSEFAAKLNHHLQRFQQNGHMTDAQRELALKRLVS